MLTDKQMQEISKAVADISAATRKHPTHIVYGVLDMFEDTPKGRVESYNRCMRWLFDNQQSYPFLITKQDMLY